MSWIIKIFLLILGPEIAALLLHRYSPAWRSMGVTTLVVLGGIIIDIPVYWGIYSGVSQIYAYNEAVGHYYGLDFPLSSVGHQAIDREFFDNETEYGPMIAKAALRHGLDPMLFTAQIRQESAFNPIAISSSGAVGLGQLMPIIISWCGIADARDPEQNLDCSAQFLSFLMGKYDGSTMLSLAAYNAGEPAVNRCNCVPQNGETPNYIRAIRMYYNEYSSQAVYGPGPAAHDRASLDIRIAAKLLYAGSNPNMANGYHGAVAGWEGWDWAAGCGTPLFSPIPGMATVTYNGLDGYNYIDAAGKKWPQSTLLVIEGVGGKVRLLHGQYDVAVGSIVFGGVTRIGSEHAFGYATGCHSHVIIGE